MPHLRVGQESLVNERLKTRNYLSRIKWGSTKLNMTALMITSLLIFVQATHSYAKNLQEPVNGQIVSGEITEITENSIQVQVSGQRKTFKIVKTTQMSAVFKKDDKVLVSAEPDLTATSIQPQQGILLFIVQYPLRDANPLGLIMAPGLSWSGSCFIIVLTLGTLVALLIRMWWVARPIRKAINELESLKRNQTTMNAEILDRLDVVFSREQRLIHIWEEFRETVLVDQSSTGRVQVYNTRAAEEFFSEDNLISQHLNLSFYTSFPGIVTGIGLLLTFLAIFVGLMDVKVVKGASIEGIEGLINGLAGKFLTSIVGLSCATVYVFIEKPFLHRLSNSYYQFVLIINRLFTRRTVEHILEDIHRNLTQQTLAFQNFGVDLSTRLKEGISESLGPTLNRMVEVVERLATQQRHDNTEAIGELIAQFLRGLEGTTNTQFNELQQAIASAGRRLEEISSAGEQSQVTLSTFIQHLDESVATQNRAVHEQIGQLNATVGGVLTRMENVASEHEQRVHE